MLLPAAEVLGRSSYLHTTVATDCSDFVQYMYLGTDFWEFFSANSLDQKQKMFFLKNRSCELVTSDAVMALANRYQFVTQLTKIVTQLTNVTNRCTLNPKP